MSDTTETRPTQRKGLPEEFILCPKEDLIILITRMLNTLIPMNDGLNESIELSTAELTRFHSRTPPGISVHNYLSRLARYSSLENAVLLAAVYYIDLLTAVYRPFTINSLTVHRFLLTVTTVGSKGLCDSFCTNTHYAKVGGIQPNELDILEREFLQRVKYRVLPRELNIERCAAELQTDLSKERKNSVEALKASENDLCNAPQDHELNVQDINRVHLRRNGGFTVLDKFYKRMLNVFGQSTGLDEAPVAYLYTIDPDYKVEGDAPNLININADTLDDETYRKQMQLVVSEIDNNSKQSQKVPFEKQQINTKPCAQTDTTGPRHVQILVPQLQQVWKDSISYENSHGTGMVYPRSPLKRPNTELDTPVPSGKRNSSLSS